MPAPIPTPAKIKPFAMPRSWVGDPTRHKLIGRRIDNRFTGAEKKADRNKKKKRVQDLKAARR
jgi:hypothetical protein